MPYTIYGLQPNTQYSIRTRIRRTDSQLWTESGYIYETTKDIARVTSALNANLGDSETILYSNPSNSSIEIGIFDVAGIIAFAEYRTCYNSSYTFNFTDNELDKIYKALGKVNSGTFVVYIKTAGAYLDSKQFTITLTGNQKTGRVNVGGVYKRSKKWTNVNGVWRRCVRWVNVNGSWKRCA